MAKSRTHCRQGHLFTDETVYRDSRGGRTCKTCALVRSRKVSPVVKSERAKRYYQRHAQAIKEKVNAHRKANRNDDLARKRAYRRANPGYRNQYDKARKSVDPAYRMICNFRIRLSKVMTRGTAGIKTIDLIGCSPADLRKHIEVQFQVGMTWGNYGDWHVDHVRPLSSFDTSDADQIRAAFHFSNLSPLWATDNRKKWHYYSPQGSETIIITSQAEEGIVQRTTA